MTDNNISMTDPKPHGMHKKTFADYIQLWSMTNPIIWQYGYGSLLPRDQSSSSSVDEADSSDR